MKLDTVFDSLTNRRRRFVLYYLKQRDGTVELDELARQVAAWEIGTTPERVTDEQYRRMYTDLFHTHLPKLSDAGIVDYDERTGVVRLWEHATLLKNVLQLASWLERPDSD